MSFYLKGIEKIISIRQMSVIVSCQGGEQNLINRSYTDWFTKNNEGSFIFISINILQQSGLIHITGYAVEIHKK
jgi:hypothetical protein